MVIGERIIQNLRFADDTTLLDEREGHDTVNFENQESKLKKMGLHLIKKQRSYDSK